MITVGSHKGERLHFGYKCVLKMRIQFAIMNTVNKIYALYIHKIKGKANVAFEWE